MLSFAGAEDALGGVRPAGMVAVADEPINEALLSPDGKHLAFGLQASDSDVYLLEGALP